MQADACRAAMAHAKDVAGAAAKAGTEQDPGSADGGEEVNSAISDHGTKNDEEGEGVTKAGLESSQTTSVPIAPCSAGHLASDSTTLSTDEGTADTASQRVTLKLNRAKEVLQEHKNDEGMNHE